MAGTEKNVPTENSGDLRLPPLHSSCTCRLELELSVSGLKINVGVVMVNTPDPPSDSACMKFGGLDKGEDCVLEDTDHISPVSYLRQTSRPTVRSTRTLNLS